MSVYYGRNPLCEHYVSARGLSKVSTGCVRSRKKIGIGECVRRETPRRADYVIRATVAARIRDGDASTAATAAVASLVGVCGKIAMCMHVARSFGRVATASARRVLPGRGRRSDGERNAAET